MPVTVCTCAHADRTPAWDLRFSTAQELCSFAVLDNVLVAGGQGEVFFWDRRSPGQPVVTMQDTHMEDVTQVCCCLCGVGGYFMQAHAHAHQHTPQEPVLFLASSFTNESGICSPTRAKTNSRGRLEHIYIQIFTYHDAASLLEPRSA